MKESILHYVWQYKLFSTYNLKTTDGSSVEVIDVGKYNTDAGPDFLNAKIKIDNIVWAGNVEIHLLSSDWMKHKHHTDKAYDNVILHLVLKADCEILRLNKTKIPQLELIFPNTIVTEYDALQKGKNNIACFEKINLIPAVFIQSWKNALLFERLEKKTEAINESLNKNCGHWEESFYVFLARNFGFSINSQPFEALANSLPIKLLSKHKNNPLQLEALLFGQAGLLPQLAVDAYSELLLKEYRFLQSKYDLKTNLDASQWKMLRLRPINFPFIRIAQFAALIHSSSKLFSKIVENPELEALKKLFACEPSDYWKTHYRFVAQEGRKTDKKLGTQSINVIIINTVLPFLFCYGQQHDNSELKEIVVKILEEMPAEKNSIISRWDKVGLKSTSAFDSQAFIQLWEKYCDEKNCLRCRIGHKILSKPTPNNDAY